MQPIWITFDCFGTLVDWNTGFRRLLQPIAGSEVEQLIAAFHRFERRFELAKPHVLYKQIVGASLLAAAEDCKVTLTTTQIDYVLNQWHALPLFPDTEFMLETLRKMGCKLGVLTNCDNDMFDRTQHLFKTSFDAVITAETARNYKPAAAHFQLFWRQSGVDRRRWIQVASSLYHDIYPAAEMKIHRIWLNRNDSDKVPSVPVHSANTGTKAVRLIQNLLTTDEMQASLP